MNCNLNNDGVQIARCIFSFGFLKIELYLRVLDSRGYVAVAAVFFFFILCLVGLGAMS